MISIKDCFFGWRNPCGQPLEQEVHKFAVEGCCSFQQTVPSCPVDIRSSLGMQSRGCRAEWTRSMH
jgi:hypothetical protein